MRKDQIRAERTQWYHALTYTSPEFLIHMDNPSQTLYISEQYLSLGPGYEKFFFLRLSIFADRSVPSCARQ